MTAMIQQQTPITLRAQQQQQQQQDQALNSSGRKKSSDDSALASYLTNKLQLNQQPQQDAWSYPQTMMVPSNAAVPVTNTVGPVDWSHPTTATATTPNTYYCYGNAAPYACNDNRQQPQQHQQRPATSRSSRPRTPSETSHSSVGIQVQKSSSTPSRQQYNRQNRSSQLLKQQQQQHYRRERQGQQQQSERPPSLSSTASSVPSPAPSLDSGRRSSITSVSSGTFSIRSDMSVNTKLSLSKRLRKVFSMSHLRSKDNLGMIPSHSNGSNTSLATVHESADSSSPPHPSSRPSRRRSFASLFQKNQQDATDVVTPTTRAAPGERPALRVDTTDAAIRQSLFKGESPRMKSRSEALPSPTPSTASSVASSQREDAMAPPAAVGIHYGLPLHGSPRLKPTAASSTSSLNTMTNASTTTTNVNRRLQFCPTIQVHETFAASEYDRRCDTNATCQKMTPMMAMKIKQELNEYKLTDMEVNVESRQYTHFFL